MFGVLIARGLSTPAEELAQENSELKGQVSQLSGQINQKNQQIEQLQHQLVNPPVVQTAQVGFEFGWRIALLILLLGSAVAIVSFLFVQARLIRPNRQGQFPVVVDKTMGQVAYTDLNLQVAPTAVLEKPSLRQQLSTMVRGGTEDAIAVNHRGVLDTQAQFEVKRGTQLVQVMIASATTSTQSALAGDVQQRSRALAAPGIAALLQTSIRPELPPVNVIELRPGQEHQIARVFQKHAVVY
jgi:hypothetical protein